MEIGEFRECVGNNIKLLRKRKHLTQASVAEAIGIETHNLNRIENGKSFPQIKTLVNIVNFFDVNASEIFDITKFKDDRVSKILQLLNENPNRVEDIYKIVLAITK